MARSRDGCSIDWTPSVYYAESLVKCELQTAWGILLDYEKWNPSLVGAKVTPLSGKRHTEGEVVLIKKGELPEFYATTVKIVPLRHFVGYMYPKEGESFLNFMDFGLIEAPSGVRFSICYYEQSQLPMHALSEHREGYQAALQESALAFKKHCEAHG